MRDVATCPELSCDYVHASGEMGSQSKPLTADNETCTESAPSMLPVPHSTASDMNQLWVSHSAPVVGAPRVSVSAGRQVQCGQDVVNTGGNRSDSDMDVTSTVVGRRPTDDATSVVPPSLGNTAEAVARLSQTVADGDAVQQHNMNLVAGPGLTYTRDETVEMEAVPADSNREETVHNYARPSINPAPCELKADSVASTSNAMCTDQVPSTSLSNETVADSAEVMSKSVSESGNRPAFAALRPVVEMPYVDTSIDTSCDSAAMQCAEPESASESMTAIVSEDTNMSVTEGDQLCDLSATVPDVGDGFTCCMGAVADCDESHSTVDDLHLVSKLIPVCRVFFCMLHMHVLCNSHPISEVRVTAGIINMGN